ncbi:MULTISPECIES: hypothetical protein [Elizabethkingia]|uniref:hypothetical protein n=1 Tax=Elizabethkingia TaxID=308865 RepID=UPI0023B051F2|nr:hypothetical protein [Elizabethkingia meningoseptica]MCT4135065.1 hypothetical protein [Elizabethkingia anophelis]MCT4148181.1 hypothetical protein [Elizabethkingia anophelis]MDE5516426.1 hypothetical protein [Elizabethkingia meningoseptica]MDE5526671.1 hypothetical protein [Elizabethkingia meningoseptica]MDN4033716.1 hypothetical protein [Elizabethkingia meningoseptica]
MSEIQQREKTKYYASSYKNGQYTIQHKQDESPKKGERFRALFFGGKLFEITKVDEVRDHRGVFDSPEKRWLVSTVTAQFVSEQSLFD